MRLHNTAGHAIRTMVQVASQPPDQITQISEISSKQDVPESIYQSIFPGMLPADWQLTGWSGVRYSPPSWYPYAPGSAAFQDFQSRFKKTFQQRMHSIPIILCSHLSLGQRMLPWSTSFLSSQRSSPALFPASSAWWAAWARRRSWEPKRWTGPLRHTLKLIYYGSLRPLLPTPCSSGPYRQSSAPRYSVTTSAAWLLNE